MNGYIRITNFLGLNIANFTAIKVVNSLCVAIIIFFQWNSIKLFCINRAVSVFYLILILFCYPLYFYSSFVYGDIPSVTCMVISSYFLLRFYQKKKWIDIGAGAIVIAISILIKSNSMIYLIAISILLILISINQKEWRYSVGMVIIIFTWFILDFGLISSYEDKADAKLGEGISKYAWIAMGLQDGPNGAGGYNNYNFDLYINSGGDQEWMKEVAIEDIKHSLSEYIKNPYKGISFFLEKFLQQWSIGEMSSRYATMISRGEKSKLLKEIYEGSLVNIFVFITDLFQFIIYFGGMVFAIGRLKGKVLDKDNMLLDMWGLTLVGGVLFHLMWEASARYAFTYFILIIPCACVGLHCGIEYIKHAKILKITKD